MKFSNNIQFDDFTAITTNLRSNIGEVVLGLPNQPGLSRTEKQLIGETLTSYLEGGNPSNLMIRIHEGKYHVGPRLEGRLRQSVGGLPVEFLE